MLARDNKIPVDISFHMLALHPFGRDYRQDPLGFRDQLVYNTSTDTTTTATTSSAIINRMSKSNTNKKRSGLISPLLARQKLQQIIKSNKDLLKDSELRKLKKNSEFAREMLMLPLSIKHPDVPMTSSNKGGGGGRKRFSLANLLKSSETRFMYGPER